MKIVALVTGEGLTKNLYDQLMRDMKIEENPPTGLITHIATFDSNGIRVTDVWESENDFNTFAENRLKPGFQKIGYNNRPKTETYPLHNYVETQTMKRTTAAR